MITPEIREQIKNAILEMGKLDVAALDFAARCRKMVETCFRYPAVDAEYFADRIMRGLPNEVALAKAAFRNQRSRGLEGLLNGLMTFEEPGQRKELPN